MTRVIPVASHRPGSRSASWQTLPYMAPISLCARHEATREDLVSVSWGSHDGLCDQCEDEREQREEERRARAAEEDRC